MKHPFFTDAHSGAVAVCLVAELLRVPILKQALLAQYIPVADFEDACVSARQDDLADRILKRISREFSGPCFPDPRFP
jgi:hypothetical protein